MPPGVVVVRGESAADASVLAGTARASAGRAFDIAAARDGCYADVERDADFNPLRDNKTHGAASGCGFAADVRITDTACFNITNGCIRQKLYGKTDVCIFIARFIAVIGAGGSGSFVLIAHLT